MNRPRWGYVMAICALLTNSTPAGPYNEPGIPGYVGPDGRHADPRDLDAVINPIFRSWATEVVSYEPATGIEDPFNDPGKALGPVTGDMYDIVSLGDLDEQQIVKGVPPGRITVSFSEPIPRGPGFEIVVFENGMTYNQRVFAELAYVEVSSDGVHFARFSSVSLTPGPVYYGDANMATIDGANVHNLAGKHPNNYEACFGTPFDLDELAAEPNVAAGLVDINNIWYVRIVDIPGNGAFHDEGVRHIEPNTWPNWDYYDVNHPIYDPWDQLQVYFSAGFDLEAVGVLHPQQCAGDTNLDGIVDGDDLIQFASSWLSHFGQPRWNSRCDVAGPKDLVINFADFAVLAAKWRQTEQWHEP